MSYASQFRFTSHSLNRRAPKGGFRASIPQIEIFSEKSTVDTLGSVHTVNAMLSKVLCDLPFSRNQPLKMAGDYNIGIFKNQIKS